jgi:hypothetical protein
MKARASSPDFPLFIAAFDHPSSTLTETTPVMAADEAGGISGIESAA